MRERHPRPQPDVVTATTDERASKQRVRLTSRVRLLNGLPESASPLALAGGELLPRRGKRAEGPGREPRLEEGDRPVNERDIIGELYSWRAGGRGIDEGFGGGGEGRIEGIS